MTKEDVKIVLSSATGRDVYIQAMISRTVARKIETLLEQNNVATTLFWQRKHDPENEGEPV